jgi:type VII secretion protein EccE
LTGRLVIGELSAGLAVAGAACGTPWLVSAAAVAAVGVSVAAAGRLPRVPRRRRRDSASAGNGLSELFPYPYEDRGRRIVGMVGDGTFLAAVVRVDPGAGTGLEPMGGAGELPLSLLSDALDVDGIALASAQLVQQVRGGGSAGAPAVRLTWVALRLEPGWCPAAVAARGGGLGGAQRCLVLAADQVASRVVGAGLGAAVLDQEGVDSALSAVSCTDGGSAVYAVGGPRVRAPALLAAPSGRSTTLGLTVRRGALRGSAEVAGHVRVTAADQRELGNVQEELERAARTARVALVRMERAQLPGVLATSPLGGAARRGPGRSGGDAGLPVVPVGGDGVLVGADDGVDDRVDDEGRPMLLGVHRPAPYDVLLIGGLWTAQLLAVRAAGAGAGVRVAVETARAQAWAGVAGLAGVELFEVGRVPSLGAAEGRPVMVVRDCGMRPPRGRVVPTPWQTVLTLLPYLSPVAPGLVRGAALVGVQRVSPDEARQLGQLLRLSPEESAALPGLGDGVTLWCAGRERQRVTCVADGPEGALLGPARRMD